MKKLKELSRNDIYKSMEKLSFTAPKNTNSSTLNGKVVSGYQGWFNAPEDSAEHGWYSWDRNNVFKPGSCTIDLWPDMDELDEDEKYKTPFVHADGSTATVYSAYNKKTVVRHFKWMREYGIHGAFVQRFVQGLDDPVILNHRNKVLSNCREGANIYGRSYNVMYDLSGIDSNGIDLLIEDWKELVHNGISLRADDQAYQYHNGKPLVSIWGIGFNDNRDYDLQDCMRLVDFFKNDPVYGGNTLMLGVPTGWREQNSDHFYVPKVSKRYSVMDGDSVQDTFLHEIIRKADIVSPWTVDRYDDLQGIETIAESIWVHDQEWCRKEGLEFLPVVFPGFSWGNLYQGQSYNQIPRQKGRFLWKQYYELAKIDASMVYQAMFDEVNEGTAIFKCSNDPPIGESHFLNNEGLESDYYLWLVGRGAEMIRKDIPLSADIPKRHKD